MSFAARTTVALSVDRDDRHGTTVIVIPSMALDASLDLAFSQGEAATAGR